LNFQPMRVWNFLISASAARDATTNETSRCARWMAAPSKWSARYEQLGQPASQPGPSMK